MTSVGQLLDQVTGALPGGGESRPGQLMMADLVAETLADEGVLLVEAGTGTGKSLAYLVPVLARGHRAVVATATIALQSQLVDIDVPQVARALGRPVTVALLKGRRNYLCVQRLAELQRAQRAEQLQLLGGRAPDDRLDEVIDWAEETLTGDREELDPAPPEDVWAAVSVGGDECPGAARCPSGSDCFAERARQRAAEADVVVTNHHLYGLNVAAGGALLPEHDAVVFDEAHQLPEVLGATCGTEIGGGRIRALARRVRGVLTDDALPTDLDRSAADLDRLLRPHIGDALRELTDVVALLVGARDRAERVVAGLRKLNPSEGSDVAARIERTMLAASRMVDDIDSVLEAADSDVIWVDGGPGDDPILRRTPLELGDLLEETLWDDRAVVLTSATLPDGVITRLGLDEATEVDRVGSPFDYPELGLLYCPTDLPSPKRTDHRQAVQDEIIGLVEAAGGRALCLFTSYGAMTEAAERFESELDVPVMVQGQAPKGALIERFKADPSSVLLATLSFWQGIDLPGSTLTLVTIDRIPFPRPDEPVTQARRDRAGRFAFRDVDLPRAQTLLAQAAGRLVRRADDRGVVAVLDPRLATAKSYRWELINALPPLRRTKDRDEVLDFLRGLDREAADQ
jgi:ATP-dependent DNA helicase DinG